VDDHIYAIDWDTAGFGYLGEDMASLIADETEPANMADYFRICIPAYLGGFFEYAHILVDAEQSIHDMILLMYGYRLIESFKFAQNEKDKSIARDSLQSIYDLSHMIPNK